LTSQSLIASKCHNFVNFCKHVFYNTTHATLLQRPLVLEPSIDDFRKIASVDYGLVQALICAGPATWLRASTAAAELR
jgi:hypothetical protein